jgi:diguanylate cyclase (GGDEF)-like protein
MIATVDSQLLSLTAKRLIVDPPNQQTIIRLRWLVVIVSAYMLIFPEQRLLEPVLIQGFALFYLLSNAALYFLPERFFKSLRLFSLLVIFDTLALSFCLIVTGQLGSDLYLTYFLIIIIAGFWRDFRWSLGFAVVVSLLYSGLLFLSESLTTYLFLRVPFLFAASLLYGYFTHVLNNERILREKAEQEARSDFLTSLPNRQAYDERVQEEIERANRYSRSLSLLMIDIDDFKMINDTFGHPCGDIVLRQMAKLLNNNIRRMDFVARYGGEEFVIILPETALQGALELAKRIRSVIKESPFETANGLLYLTASIGVSTHQVKDSADAVQMSLEADQALYRAKRSGKDRVETLSL